MGKGYEDGAKQIEKIVRTVDGFTTENVSREDWGILNSGKARTYAIIRPGAHTSEPVSIGQRTVHTTWNSVVEVWTLADSIAAPAADLQRKANEILEVISLYPYLGDSSFILASMAVSGDEMQEKQLKTNGALWATWDLVIGWLQERKVTPLE